MRIIICDDDAQIVNQLNQLLIEFFNRNKFSMPDIQTYETGELLLQDSKEQDIIFLDIEMPGADGIYVGQTIKSKKPNAIIFVITAFLEYMDDAMRFHVFRYLSKPIEKQRLFRNLKDALQLFYSSTALIAVETKEGVFSTSADDIVCVEAQGRKTIVHTLDNSYFSIPKIDYWLNTLNFPCFFRSHRSFIVNMRYVTSFDHFLIYLNNNTRTAYLAQRKYTQFKKIYFSYLESMR